jgi:hypothetical protein
VDSTQRRGAPNRRVLDYFRDKAPQVVVNHILGRLYALFQDNPRRLHEYTDMLEILPENRDLTSQIEGAKKCLLR